MAIGASAGTATWSGWVGLGELTGFGIVHPLPGIAESFTINTAVTLPIGVEAYAMYALSIATTSRPLAERTRRYAWISSGAALLLGMAGQIAYHLMTAGEPIRSTPQGIAPWWVIALVSCLPVIVLGAASLLWHLAGEPAPVDTERSAAAEAEALPEGDDEPASSAEPAPPQPTNRRRQSASVAARPEDIARVQDAVRTGQLQHPLSAKRIRALLSISPGYARAARDALTAKPNSAATDSPPSSEPQEMTEPLFSDEQHQQASKQILSDSDTASQQGKKSSDDEQPDKAAGKAEEVHTYATQLT